MATFFWPIGDRINGLPLDCQSETTSHKFNIVGIRYTVSCSPPFGLKIKSNLVAHNVTLFLSYFPLSRYLQYTLVSESKKCFLVEYPAIEYTILIS